MIDNSSILHIEHVTKWFDDKEVLNDINVDIHKGEFVTILGPSGCGKTTLLRMLAGFEVPTSGKIFFNGKDITMLPPNRRPMNTVFQRYALFPHLNVYENVAFGLKLQGKKANEIDRLVVDALHLVGLDDYEERNVNQLSGGQQQRVAIARAVVNKPQVLLLDEPLSALDQKLRKEMQRELKRMHEELGITFIFVTHDQEEALTMSDTVIVMNGGVIQQMGAPKSIYDEPINTFVADFIGESNIIDGTMIDDYYVEILDKKVACADHNMGQNKPAHIVIRPEDIMLAKNPDEGIWQGVVRSSNFKGIHYDMYVKTDSGYEFQVQDYNNYEVGTRVGITVMPDGMHVILKEND